MRVLQGRVFSNSTLFLQERVSDPLLLHQREQTNFQTGLAGG